MVAAASRRRSQAPAAGRTVAPPSAAAKSPAVAKRALRSFSSARLTAPATVSGMGPMSPRPGAAASRWRARTRCGVVPPNGGSPVSISNNTQPRLYTSARPSTSSSPAACSGLMYSGVPTAIPTAVTRIPPAALTAREMPKSATSAWPDWNRMFSGFTSRCTMPRALAKCSASATSRAIATASSTGRRVRASKRWRSDSPSTYGMT